MINQLKTILLLGILTALLLAVGNLLGGQAGLTVALFFVLLMNMITYFFSDKIVLLMYRAKEAPKSKYHYLHEIVEDVCKLAKIPKPKIYVIPTETPNAFATGRNPKHAAIACTEGILKLLSKEELKGVISHEISHIRNRDILITTIAATIAGVIFYVARMAQFAAMFGGSRDRQGQGNVLSLLVLAIITPIIAMLLQLAISRSREYFADETGAKTIKNPSALANALHKLESGVRMHPLGFGNQATSSLFIVNPFSAHGLINLLSTHPPLNLRVKRLKEMKI